MEHLKELERLQSMLTFLQSRGITTSTKSNTDSSHRFLSSLLLLLVQPHGDLGYDDKLNLISEFVPKISPSSLKEASIWLTEEGNPEMSVERTLQQNCNTKSDDTLQGCFERMAVVGPDAMQRANSTLEDFFRSYLMFHGMDVNNPQSVFKYLPMLSFTESFIYQLDSLNEKTLCTASSQNTEFERGLKVVTRNSDTKFCGYLLTCQVLQSDPFRPLKTLLEDHGLLTGRIKEEMRHGEEYWALERKLCRSLKDKIEISVEDMMRAIHLKSFDYRVLNLLLYELRGAEVNNLHMEFLSISEFLVEVSDDLFDYEDDVIENNFNSLRMFVHIYGASAAPAMLAKYITEAEEKYVSLLKLLDPELSMNYQSRCVEATIEGGEKSGSPLGRWSIPPIIVDEELYRSKLASPP